MIMNPYTQAYPNAYVTPYVNQAPVISQQTQPDVRQFKNQDAPNVLQYTADVSGCALYRMGFPQFCLNYTGKANVFNSSIMIQDAAYYTPLSVVRIQRQAKNEQKEFVKRLCKLREQYKFKLLYEIDDIVFAEDIPDYNTNKHAFESKEIRQNIEEIMNMCDEITVTCDFMRDYYSSKLNNNKVTVVPNFQPRMWFDRFYDQNKINAAYDKNKNKPRILYCGSAGHYDVKGKGVADDVTHIIDAVIKTRNDFQWVFMGMVPRALQGYAQMGVIEHHPFVDLIAYPGAVAKLGVQAAIAPLANNNFNKAKSDIKWTEMCALGIPCICQDLCTYEKAWWKFNTGDEMIDQIKSVVGKAGHYKNLGAKLYKEAQKNWLDNEENIGCYTDLFKYDFGSSERKYLNRFNG